MLKTFQCFNSKNLWFIYVIIIKYQQYTKKLQKRYKKTQKFINVTLTVKM